MFAPIFTWELQRTMQRRWFHAARMMFAAVALSLFLWHLTEVTTFLKHPGFRRSLPTFLGQTSEFEHYLKASLYGLIFLLTPILAAGPILQEKRQKTLELLLTTQQRSADIILGHWLAALAKLLILTSPVIPVLIWLHAFRGETPMIWIIAWIGCAWLLALPISAWSILVAVYARQTSTALLFGYVGSVLLHASLAAGFRDAQLAGWPYAHYNGDFWTNFAILIFAPTALCLIIAISQLRSAFAAAPEREVRAAANRPTLAVSDQPILWKQTHCNDVLMPRFVRWLPRWARVVGFIAITVAVASLPDRSGIWSMLEGFGAPVVFSLVAIVMGGSSISTERELGTWDSLRLTLVNAPEIVNDTITPLVSGLRRYWLALLPAVIVAIGKQPGALLAWDLLFIVALAGVMLWAFTGVLLYHAAVAGLSSAVLSQTSLGSLIYAISRFTATVAIVGTMSAVGAGGIGLFGCFFVCMVANRSEGLAALLFAADLLLIGVVFFRFAHMMLCDWTELRRAETIENLVKHHGFERDGASDSTPHQSEPA
jgi:hypothetical protein